MPRGLSLQGFSGDLRRGSAHLRKSGQEMSAQLPEEAMAAATASSAAHSSGRGEGRGGGRVAGC